MDPSYRYVKIFNPDAWTPPRPMRARGVAADAGDRAGDRQDGTRYVFDPKVVLAVNVALATGRPLLVRGASGGGKSSLTRAVAVRMGRRFFEHVVTSRTEAQELLWTFDALRRLGDAQAGVGGTARGAKGAKAAGDAAGPLDPRHYVEPGVLWWAFDRESARRRGAARGKLPPSMTPANEPPFAPASTAGGPPRPQPDTDDAVVLIDEIDKADPDIPNNLLIPIGSFAFTVTELGASVRAAAPPLVIITSNDERDPPQAFRPRCVEVELPTPGRERLTEVGVAHFGEAQRERCELVAARLIRRVETDADAADAGAGAAPPSPPPAASAAEYLDLVQASLRLNVQPDDGDATWAEVLKATVFKPSSSARPTV